MDAAELAFAAHGYTRASLRLIVEKAHVTQALITYYFGSKEQLFKEVFTRRGREITEKRLAALEALRRKGPRLKMADIVAAYLAPALAMRQTRQGRAFIKLQARLHTEPPGFADQLRRDVYDAAVRDYIQLIRAAAPHITEKAAYWRMILLIGAYLYAHSDAHRLSELAPGICDPESDGEMLEQISAFVVGGLMANDLPRAPGPMKRPARTARPRAPGSGARVRRPVAVTA